MFCFFVQTSKGRLEVKKRSIKFDNSENQLNDKLNIVILKDLHTTKCFAKCYFFLHKIVSRQFFIFLELFYAN